MKKRPLARTFTVKNPNPLPFFLDRLDFELEAHLQVFTFFIGQTGYRMLLEGRPLDYSIGGTAFFSAPLLAEGVLDLPFDIDGTIVARR
jgi:hypothetical protein